MQKLTCWLLTLLLQFLDLGSQPGHFLREFGEILVPHLPSLLLQLRQPGQQEALLFPQILLQPLRSGW